MRSIRIFCIALALITCHFSASHLSTAEAEELAVVNHPVNMTGLSGLLLTTAPYTVSRNTVEIAASAVSETSFQPEYTITQFPISMTFGIGNSSELAFRSSYYHINEGPSGTTPVEYPTGTIDVFYKWNFLRGEDSMQPAAALIVGGSFPAKQKNILVEGVNSPELRLGLSGGMEIAWQDHALGLYTDFSLINVSNVKDSTGAKRQFIYDLFNIGLLLPISKYQNLQMFAEYTMTHGRYSIYIDGGDYSGITYGLRLVSERFNFTMGTQFLHKRADGFDPSDKIMGLMSIKL